MVNQQYHGCVERIKDGSRNFAYFNRQYFESQIRCRILEGLKQGHENPFNWGVEDLVASIKKGGLQIQRSNAKIVSISVKDTPSGWLEYDLSGSEYKDMSAPPLIWPGCYLNVEMTDLSSPTLPITKMGYDTEFDKSFGDYINKKMIILLRKPKNWNDPKQVAEYHKRLNALFTRKPALKV